MGVIDRKSFRSAFLNITAVATLLALTLIASPARAATITIAAASMDDALSGKTFCTLRDAVTAINTGGGTTGGCIAVGVYGTADTINVPVGTYTITGAANDDANLSGDLDITKAVTIIGAGAGATVIQAGTAGPPTPNGIDRVFHVTANVPVTFDSLTIRNGNFAGAGGGIWSAGVLTLNTATVTGNTVGFWDSGGGIDTSADITLINSTISFNTAGWEGGGFRSTGAATLTNSTITGNTSGPNSSGWGGGFSAGGALVMTNSIVSGNSAVGYPKNCGGFCAYGSANIINSTISGNTTAFEGGGFYVWGPLTLDNSTVDGNWAVTGGGFYAAGTVAVTNSTVSGNSVAQSAGAIMSLNANMTISNSTIYGNTAPFSPGGIIAFFGNAFVNNSIIANNTGGDCGSFGISAISSGYNIDSDGSCNLIGPGDLPFTAITLPALANNGGPTMTHSLPLGNPAIGVNATCAGAQLTDQRGVARPQGSGCDSGAFEADFMLLTVAVTGGGSVTGGTAINCPATPCSESHWPGTVVTLTATPGPGEAFTGWGGACAGPVLTCTVTMNTTQTVTANFAPNTLAVAVTGTGTVISDIPGTGVGISCNPTCADNYNVGAVVTLTATPGAGQYFTGWGGACAGATPTCVVTMSAAQNVTAAFGAQDSLSVTILGSGDVTSDVGVINCIDNAGSCSDIFIPGTVVTLTATPSAGYAFTGWTGACTGTGACVVTMAGATSVTAMFELSGCTDPTATNYNPLAVVDDGSCIFSSNSIAITVDVTDGQGGKATKTLKLTPQ